MMPMPDLPDLRRVVRSQAAKAFGGRGSAVQVAGRTGSSIEVLTYAPSPVPGVASYSTVGLANSPVFKDERPMAIRVELLAAAYERFSMIPQVLGSAAARIIEDRWLCAPGVIFPDLLEISTFSRHLCDLYFAPPFLWGEMPTDLELGEVSLAWLLAVPIARPESMYAQTKGPLALEKVLEETAIDVFDWDRPAVL